MPRRRGNPILVLVCLTSSSRHCSPSDGVGPTPRPLHPTRRPHRSAGDAGDVVAVATPVLSMRRAPGILSRDLNLAAFQDALQPLVDRLDETSCVAVSVDGVAVAAKNESVPVIPASNMKVIVAAVALDVLGPDHRFTTSVLGEVDAAGVVNGNLYLVGGGDPVLSTDWWVARGGEVMTHPVTNSTRVEDLALAVVAKGVRRITGSVVGDATRYDDEYFAPSWDESVRRVEAGPYDALLISDGRTSLTTVGDEPPVASAQVFGEILEANGVTVEGEPVAGRATVTSRARDDRVAAVAGDPRRDADDE
jgi:D-alanyl-D-alanine carboxypeptidase/D-alanyl-D-alanine-endopeptidase (penicillin-binding protein 4)